MSSTTPGSEPDRLHDDAPVDGDVQDPVEARDAAPDEPVESRPEPAAASDTPEADDAPEPPEAEPTPAEPTPARLTPAATAPVLAEPEPEVVEATDTAHLDAAVERAKTEPVADPNDVGDRDVPAPLAAADARRETYVPAATVAAGTATGAATLAPEPYVAPAAAAGPQTVYVQAPTPPATRGNRGFGALVALIGTVVFALLYAGISYLILLARGDAVQASSVFTEFLVQPVFWIPVLACFVGFALLAAIVNRGPWWYYAVFGLLVGVLVYFSYIGASLLYAQTWTMTLDQATEFLSQRWLDPFAITAGVVAREIPIWFGGWIAARGRTVAERNRLAREAYDRELAAGPQPVRV